VTVHRLYLEEVNARMQVALDGAETEKAQLGQRLKTLEDQFRHDKQQFEVRV
jgi:BMFP domain-containing protein YqiC